MNIKHLLASLALFACTTAAMAGQAAYLLPKKVASVNQPVMSLNGKWDFQYSPTSKWTPIEVPGEVAMQGYAIEHDKPFRYRKSFNVPTDFAGQKVILRFDGVYSYAKLFVNGKFVRNHTGGFTRWETDITAHVKTGKKNSIELEVIDPLDDISYASGYAHHPIGGILRDVTLFALPQNHLFDVKIETHLDSLYKNAELAFACEFAGENGSVNLILTDPNGKQVPLTKNNFALTSGHNNIRLAVSNPMKWDAEHPNLYTLEVITSKAGKELSRTSRNVGFRKVEVVGNKMLVNGMAVKLRGACRHDIHPTLGRTTTAELDSLDAILFKRSNMNFVRTSHYPPSESFLEFCDRFGIYVECETAVCFVDTHRQKNYAPANSQNDPTYTERYLSQCREMVKSLGTHTSIILWSIGNESKYGSNFQVCWDWVKAADTTRPVIFSYPGSAPKETKVYDLLSMHYQDVYGNLWQYGMSTQNFQGHGIPALFDEWAHPACYTYSTLQNDPNIREFWGKSLDMMWSGLFDAPGGLGGAIWGYIDETFALPQPKVGTPWWKEFAYTAKPQGFQGNCVGYGDWGIVDVWRREKPEFWATKKAHSPVRLTNQHNLQFSPNQHLALTLYNRFDHTNTSEISATYTYQDVKKALPLPNIAPHCKGILEIPAENWSDGQTVLVEFFDQNNQLIDAYQYTLGYQSFILPETLAIKTITVDDNDTTLTIKGERFEIPFDKTTGLITNATANGQVIIEKGPMLNAYINLNHLTGAEVRKKANHFEIDQSQWQKSNFSYTEIDNAVLVTLSGTYQNVTATFDIKISANGQIDINYTTDNVPNGFLRETGLCFQLSDAPQNLAWNRKGYWNYYPHGEMSGNVGKTALYNDNVPKYGQKPNQPWPADTHDYYYWADQGTNCQKPLTMTAKAMKENINFYTLSGAKNSLSVVSTDASVACRISKQPNEKLMLYTNNHWDYPEIAWGNYCKTLEALPLYGHISLIVK